MGALKRGDEAAALTYAEKASAVAPQAAWAAETAHNLQVKNGKIEAAIHSLNQLSRSGGMAPKAAQRRRAALLTEQARRILAGEGGDAARAMALAREAVKLTRDDPGAFVPARLALCRSLLRQGKAKEAAKLIEQVWDDAPHAALGRVYLEAVGGDTPLDRAQRVQKLVKQNPDHAESHRIGADAALTARVWGEARKHLERLIELEQAGDDRRQRRHLPAHGAAGSRRAWRRLERRAAMAGHGGRGARRQRLGVRDLRHPGRRRHGSGRLAAVLPALRCDRQPGLAAGRRRLAPERGGVGRDRPGAVAGRGNAGTRPALAAVPPQPAAAKPAGPIPHGSLAEPAPAAASDAKTGKPAPLGASVDAARLVN